MQNIPSVVSVMFGIVNLQGLMSIKNNVVEQPLFAHQTYPIRATLDTKWDANFGKLNYIDKTKENPLDGQDYQKLYHKNVRWNFGDGTEVDGYNTTHYYTLPGRYVITCTFFDINRLGIKNAFELHVIVKQVVPTVLAFDVPQSSVETLRCSEITKIARIKATLSNNVQDVVPIIPKRLYADARCVLPYPEEYLESDRLSKLCCLLERAIYMVHGGVLTHVQITQGCIEDDEYLIDFPVYLGIWRQESTGGKKKFRKFAVSNNSCVITPGTDSDWSFEGQDVRFGSYVVQFRFLLDPNDDWDIEHDKYIPGMEKEEDDWDDVKDSDFPHLRKYWTFLKDEHEYYYDSAEVFKTTFVPTKVYNPEYTDLYGYFICIDKQLIFRCFSVEPYLDPTTLSTISVNNPNASILDVETFVEYPITKVSSITELPVEAVYVGKLGYTDIFYKSDFVNTNTMVSISFDIDSVNVYNSIKSSSNFLNIPPLGLHFAIVNNVLSDCNFTISLNGFITSFEPVDKLVQLSLVQNYSFSALLIPYIYSQYNTYYIPKDLVLSANAIHIIEDYGNDSTVAPNDDALLTPFIYRLKFICRSVMHIMLQVYENNIDINYPLKDFEKLVIPTEQYYNQDVRILFETYTPHVMFSTADRLKKFFIDLFGSNRFLDYVLTRSIHFFDDLVYTKTNYISNLVSTLAMMGENAYEYDQTVLDGVNELKDIVRILSMNHTDLMGNYIKESYDIRYSGLYVGKHIGDPISVYDKIYIDNQNRVYQLEHDGHKLRITTPNEYIVAVDNYTHASKLVNFIDWAYDTGKHFDVDSPILRRIHKGLQAGGSMSNSGDLDTITIYCDHSTIMEMPQDSVYLGIWVESSPGSGQYVKYAVSDNAVAQRPGSYLVWTFRNSSVRVPTGEFKVRWLVNSEDEWDSKYDKKSFCIGVDYNPSRNWGLLLPENTYTVSEDTPKIIASYYSFFLLKPNADEYFINQFLDSNTITQDMLDVEKWQDVYGITFDMLEKVIFDALAIYDSK